MKYYDAIVIGAGQAGVPLAKKLAGKGLKTALIEKNLVGGTCINVGCTPTKTMISSARVAHLVANSNKWGIFNQGFTVDMPSIVDRKNSVVTRFREGAEAGLNETKGLDVIFGTAAFIDKKTLQVTLPQGSVEQLVGDRLFINTGTDTTIPDIDGINKVNYLTSSTILDLQEVPSHLLIIGGGYVALEFGQLYKRLGSKVTLLEHGDRILKREDEDVAKELGKILAGDGIIIHTEAKVFQVHAHEKTIKASVQVKGDTRQFDCSHLLIAAGRHPLTRELQPANSGIALSKKGFIAVNDRLETSVAGIYAMGDVTGGPAFTHISYNDHLIIYRNLFENAGLSVRDRPVPYCMFTDPQLARVGLDENQAKEQALDFIVATLPMDHVARAIETNETKGFIKAIVDKKTKRILGATVLGVEAGEIMSVLQMAMMGNVTYEQIRYGVFAHPTFSEALNNLFMTIMD